MHGHVHQAEVPPTLAQTVDGALAMVATDRRPTRASRGFETRGLGAGGYGSSRMRAARFGAIEVTGATDEMAPVRSEPRERVPVRVRAVTKWGPAAGSVRLGRRRGRSPLVVAATFLDPRGLASGDATASASPPPPPAPPAQPCPPPAHPGPSSPAQVPAMGPPAPPAPGGPQGQLSSLQDRCIASVVARNGGQNPYGIAAVPKTAGILLAGFAGIDPLLDGAVRWRPSSLWLHRPGLPPAAERSGNSTRPARPGPWRRHRGRS